MIIERKRDALVGELLTAARPKISIYIPTHRAFPENKQDPILFKNQLKLLENELTERYPRRGWQGTLQGLYALLDDDAFWSHTTEGLGVLAANGRAEAFLLEAPAGPAIHLGDSFHLLPLYPLAGTVSQAWLADVSRDRFILYHVSGEGVSPMELPDIKTNFRELFDDFDANATLRTGSYGGLSGAFHGHGARPEEADKDREKYFRYLDGAFGELYRNTSLPLILAGTEETLAQYRQLAKGAFYLEGSIEKPLDSLDDSEILERAGRILKPHFEKSLDGLRTRISNLEKENKAVSDLPGIRKAAEEGRVDTLILPGSLKENEKALLERAAEQVLENGGRLYADKDGALGLPGNRLALLRF